MKPLLLEAVKKNQYLKMDNNSIFHILPVNDSDEHIEGFNCTCKPDIVSFDNGMILVVHNSFDHREVKEELIRDATSILHAN